RLLLRFGTFFPFARASDRPIAIACLRLVTFFLLRPLRSVPFLRFFMARSTSFDAEREYLRAISPLLAMGWSRAARQPASEPTPFGKNCCIADTEQPCPGRIKRRRAAVSASQEDLQEGKRP